MSVAALNWAFRMPLAPGPKVVLLALADCADERGECFPGIPWLADRACVSERTVQRYLAELAAAGYIEVVKRVRTNQSFTSNKYILTFAWPTEGGDNLTPPPQDVEDPAPTSGGGGGDNLTPPPRQSDTRVVTPVSPAIEPPHEPINSPPGGPPPPPDKKTGSVGTRLPSDWTLPDDWQAEAAGIGLTAAETATEAEKFRDYWTAAAGQKARKADWRATWRVWVRRAVEDRGRTPKPLNKPQAVGAGVPIQAQKHPFFAEIAKRVDGATYQSWFMPCRVRVRPDGVLEITAPSKFHRDWLVAHTEQQITFAAAAIGAGQVAIVVQNKGRAAA